MTTTDIPRRDAPEVPPSPALAATLYANGFSLYEILENYPALEIEHLAPSLRLARGIAAEYGDDAE